MTEIADNPFIAPPEPHQETHTIQIHIKGGEALASILARKLKTEIGVERVYLDEIEVV